MSETLVLAFSQLQDRQQARFRIRPKNFTFDIKKPSISVDLPVYTGILELILLQG